MRSPHTDVTNRVGDAAPDRWRILVRASLIGLFVLALLGRPLLSWFV